MPIENPFPLQISDKEDSWEKSQLLANVPFRFKYVAEEWNTILKALNYLYSICLENERMLHFPIS